MRVAELEESSLRSFHKHFQPMLAPLASAINAETADRLLLNTHAPGGQVNTASKSPRRSSRTSFSRADATESAVTSALRAGARTGDIAGPGEKVIGSEATADAVIEEIRREHSRL